MKRKSLLLVTALILLVESNASSLRGNQNVTEDDLENKYRGHDIRRSQYVINYVRDLKDENLVFDEPYQEHPIKPRLVIHGGDVSHQWSCDNFEWFLLGGCRNPDDEYKDVWERLYEAGIPMITAFGNHDWRAHNGTGNPWGEETDLPRDEEADKINLQSNKFTRMSYEKSRELTDGKLEFEEIKPTGTYGQSMYKATYAGIQIANFNSAFNWQSYDDGGVYSADDQFRRLSESLDRSLKTIFFSHYPLNGVIQGQTPNRRNITSLIREFGPGSHHFSGHYHVQAVVTYDDEEPSFNDYVAPYPHTWDGEEPGFLAILMSRSQGVLQVKTINIPGLEDGEFCIPWNYINSREYFHGVRSRSGNARQFRNSPEDGGVTEPEAVDLGDVSRCCDRCKAGKQNWSPDLRWFVCGDVE